MASETEICNIALQRVGVKRISNIKEDSPNGRACNFAYPLVRRRLLRRYPWNFAKTRVTLAPDAASPNHKFKFQFTLPTDSLRILPTPEDDDWSIEGGKILTDAGDVLKITYIRDVVDPNEFDTLFEDLMGAALASEVVMELKKSKTLKAELRADMNEILAEARRVNSFESVPVEFPEDDWISARS